MMRALIAGCGYVGQATAELFQKAGWEVEGWTATAHSAAELSAKAYRVRAVDISQPNEVATCADAFNVVIHCASSRGGGHADYRRIYWQGSRNLSDFFPRATILFTSSTSVYAQTDGSWVFETSAANPSRETAKILRETEELVLTHGGIVARLAGIYGPNRSALLEKFLRGDAIIDDRKSRFINQAHRDDIAAALFRLIECKDEFKSHGGSEALKIFNVVDDEPILQSECYQWLAAKLGRAAPPAGKSTEPRKRSDSNKKVSNKKLRSLGWAPVYPRFSDAMTRSILPSFSSVLV
ncbi:MAG: NAD-dependent epimerase/dehydratase family protein [Verrucomicrobiota bacterium]